MRALIFAFIAVFATAPVTALAEESHVWINNASQRGVWVTAFTSNCSFEIRGAERPGEKGKTLCLGSTTERHIVHEWCVPPGALVKQGFHVALTVVHVMATSNAKCGRPIKEEWVMQFPRNNGKQTITQQYNVTGDPRSEHRYYIQTVNP